MASHGALNGDRIRAYSSEWQFDEIVGASERKTVHHVDVLRTRRSTAAPT